MSQLKRIHAHVLRTAAPPHYNPDTLFLYGKILQVSSLHDINYAIKLFNQIQNPNSFIWNTILRAYARSSDQKKQAILFFYDMLSQGVILPDKHTFPFVLKACAYLFAFFEGKQIHGQALKRGFVEDVYINNSLIHFYSSCGRLDYARKVFDKMQEKSIVSWNVMINALVDLGEFEDSLRMFREMQRVFEPDGYTMQSLINACSGLGALSLGIWAHVYVKRRCKFDVNLDVLMNNSLVDMYCKCGELKFAVQVFDGMRVRDVNTWNSMILGFAMHGDVEEALFYFRKMVDEEGIRPNSITFVGVLSACNHRGLVKEGQEYFDKMINQYKIDPVLEHYGCLVDLLARAGLIEEALDLVSDMPIKPDAVIWRSLLDSCLKKNAGLELSEAVARQVIESKDNNVSIDSSVYILLSRVYASANKWNEVGLIRKLMTEKGVNKEPGCSSVEINGVVHEFFAGDSTHPQTKEIYKFLDVLDEKVKSLGYIPDASQALMVDESVEGKGQSLRLHSERLAIAFGLLNSKSLPIRVFKNLRVCNDCHNVIKLISNIYNVEITVRDRVRFHHFRDGLCSCLDYW